MLEDKTSTCGFCWGCWLAGATALQWGHIFGQLLQAASVRSPDRDYLFGSDKGPMRYACILAQFRRCLHLFTLHSMKVSRLSWGLQLEVEFGLICDASLLQVCNCVGIWRKLSCHCHSIQPKRCCPWTHHSWLYQFWFVVAAPFNSNFMALLSNV